MVLTNGRIIEFKKYAFLQNNEPVSKDTLKELLKLEIINESEYNYKIERSKRDRNSQWVKNIIGSVIAVGAVVVMIAIKLHNRQS